MIRFQHNLFSFISASENGISFIGKGNKIIFFKRNNELFVANKRGGVYVIEFEMDKTEAQALSATTMENWHRRFAHAPIEIINKMIASNAVNGLKLSTTERETCTDCAINKCNRTSHPTRSSVKATKPGQHFHFDTLGPIRPEGIGGIKSILVAKDEFSKFRFTVGLSAKSRIPEMVKQILIQAEFQTNNRTKFITSDQGTEFTSERLQIFLEQKGIKHILSATYVPQQNGTAEREIRQTLTRARSMLNSAKLPYQLWSEAIRQHI